MSHDKNYSTITSAKMKTNESIKNHQNYLLTETNNDSITLSKILSNRYTNLSRNPITLRNNDVLLTSIFQLPIINNNKKNPSLKTERRYEKSNITNNTKSLFQNYTNNENKYTLSNNNKEINNEEIKLDNNEQSEFNINKNLKNKSKKKLIPSKLETYLKDKFYIDVENKINLHLKNKKYIEDIMLHNRIVHMKKFSAFWRSIADYINPILSIEKFKLKKFLSGEPIKEEKKTKVIKHVPKLYTSIVLNDKMHKEKKERDKLYIENLIETQKSYDFY
jgi:hypothetical protein